ncbi:response regulator [Phenylobacterium sp. VNQ135]|uniref:response regulator n=1 Tax=Phenylobacterium sp. VNQ135 TaxID=3400922 RepID=UPI003C077DBA
MTSASAECANGRPLRVLHVDDDPMNLRVVQEILTAFGHAGVMACSGQEALEHLSTEVFDVVLMDVHMPGMTGIEVVERLRASLGPARNTPVIALTADVLSRRPQEYAALGFDDFVSKPILVSGLMASIHRAASGVTPGRRLSRVG